ncbi:MAG TPA: glutathione S-transferase family protein [Pseudomonadales bacterium]
MAKLTLVIGNKNYSSWSLRPWLLLRHNNVVFDEIRIPLSAPNTADLLRPHSPTLKVPVLKADSLTIWDSLAICEYVSEQCLAGEGWPQDVAARARARSFAAEMHSGFQALRSAWPMNVKLRRKLPVQGALRRDIERVCDIWDGCLAKSGGPWLFGTFGIVDAMFAPVALRFHSYQPELPPRAQAYVQAHVDNPAMREWMDAGRAETEVIKDDEVGYLLGEPGWD